MLEAKLTRNHAGLTLWGDYVSLKRLYAFIHRIVEESPIIEDKEGFVLGLAYDVRKAFEGCRSQEDRTYLNDDHCRCYGVEILWPVLLVQVGVLRQAMAFIPTNSLDQAVMYELEHAVETAVRAAMPIMADEVLHRTKRIGTAPYTHLDSVLDSRCRYFIGLTGKERLKALPRLMDTFEPIYRFLATEGATMQPGTIPPSAFVDDGSVWPDFKW
ncbi:hypothetical protein BUE93_21985 [Chromobacterium amazonense]|uniref:Uncharacterized protein n=1 Tax=Chromobacterium amazonense TaxID=1382803 RepID=A0A2S9WYD7_9NEIS|nr:hypothetical protein [Chromobacterium amazonense]PRP68475.1 hypothetical protein BUE93_21985 [Chromobacterium amazonense]